MSDLIIYAAGFVGVSFVLAYAFVAINRTLSERRDNRLKSHLNWNGAQQRVPRVSAARRA